jgi:hypothetical protein
MECLWTLCIFFFFHVTIVLMTIALDFVEVSNYNHSFSSCDLKCVCVFGLVNKVFFSMYFCNVLKWGFCTWNVGGRLSPCMCIYHDTMDAFECKCNSTSHQYKFNLNQRPSWLFGANLQATKNGVILVILNPMVIKMFSNRHRILIDKLLTIEKNCFPFKWWP